MVVKDGCTVAKIGPRSMLTAAHCLFDLRRGTPNALYQSGNLISLTYANPKDRTRSAQGSFVVRSARIHPSYRNSPLVGCGKSCTWEEAFGTDISDVGVVTFAEDLPEIPTARLQRSAPRLGSTVFITGDGCTAPGGARGAGFLWHETRVIPATYLDHEGSFARSSIDTIDRGYVITPGMSADYFTLKKASLCPGDSGGPLYAEDKTTIVGINAYYTFKPNGGPSAYNMHTRISSGGRNTRDWIDLARTQGGDPPVAE